MLSTFLIWLTYTAIANNLAADGTRSSKTKEKTPYENDQLAKFKTDTTVITLGHRKSFLEGC